MDEERFWMLVSMMLSGEASADELKELDGCLLAHPEIRQRYQAVKSIWNNEKPPQATGQAFSRHLQRLNEHLSQSSPGQESDANNFRQATRVKPFPLRRNIVLTAAIAASLLFCIVMTYPSRTRPKDAASSPQNVVSTKPGSRSKIELPDGTQVWLNADSKLEYDEKFTQGTRSVHLSGEAYFDVVKDKDHPFVIHTSAIDIKVLGTAFNVRSYQNESSTETSLLRGSVEITAHNNPERKIILKPLEKLVIQNAPPETQQKARAAKNPDDKPLVTISRVHIQTGDSAATDILWTRNKLSFDSEPLENVALKLERWFGVKVNITDDRLKDKLYTAVFEYETLDQVMEALRLTGGFRYAIDKKDVTIKP